MTGSRGCCGSFAGRWQCCGCLASWRFGASFGLASLLWRYGFAAGVILAATFAALAQLPSVSVTEVGTAIAIGVLVDTLLVRTVLVPGTFMTIGNRIWWPKPLQG